MDVFVVLGYAALLVGCALTFYIVAKFLYIGFHDLLDNDD